METTIIIGDVDPYFNCDDDDWHCSDFSRNWCAHCSWQSVAVFDVMENFAPWLWLWVQQCDSFAIFFGNYGWPPGNQQRIVFWLDKLTINLLMMLFLSLTLLQINRDNLIVSLWCLQGWVNHSLGCSQSVGMHIVEYRVLWILILQYLNLKSEFF